MPVFSVFEERLSHVPRWGIVRTIQRQSVAEHSFRVALIAPRIAKEYFHVDHPMELYEIMRFALLHDQLEAFTGDIPSPCKAYFNQESYKAVRLEGKVLEVVGVTSKAKKIVKIADLYETAAFLVVDMAMGNKTLDRIYLDVVGCLRTECGADRAMYDKLEAEIQLSFKLPQDPLNDKAGEGSRRGVVSELR